MPLGHIDFEPRDQRGGDDLADAVGWYGACLWKNGQAAMDYIVCDIGLKWRLTTWLFGRGAHLKNAHADYGLEALARAASLCKRRPKWHVERLGADNDDVAPWKGAPSLYMQTPSLDGGDFPVRRGDNGKPIATYTLPLTGIGRENLAGWYWSARLFADLWLQSGELEFESYRVISNVRSDTIRTGREYCAAIETATGIPTYLEVYRHYSHKHGEHKRPCPGCGKSWARKRGDRGIAVYEFRCDRCRIVQWAGVGMDEGERAARIGDWKSGPAIPSAAAMCRQIKRRKMISWFLPQ